MRRYQNAADLSGRFAIRLPQKVRMFQEILGMERLRKAKPVLLAIAAVCGLLVTVGGGAERHLPRDKRRSRHRLPMPINRGKAQGLHSRLLILKPTELASNLFSSSNGRAACAATIAIRCWPRVCGWSRCRQEIPRGQQNNHAGTSKSSLS